MSNKLHGGIKAGSVDVSLAAELRNASDSLETTGKIHSDVTASYWRQGGVRTSITMATLGSVNAAHSDGGFVEVDATNQPGIYRFDVPDAAFASGADWVVISLKVAGSFVCSFQYALEVRGVSDISNSDGTANAKLADVAHGGASATLILSSFDPTDVTIGGDFIVTGQINTASLTISGNLTIGNVILTNDFSVGNDFLVANNFVIDADFNINNSMVVPLLSTVLGAESITAASLSVNAGTEIAAAVNTNLTSNHGAGTWGISSSGGGAYAITVTVTDGTDPLQNATVRVTGGPTPGILTTDVNGQASFSLDAGTYTVAVTKTNFQFEATSRTVTGSQAGTLVQDLEMTAAPGPGVPSSPTMCLIEGYLIDQRTGLPLVGIQLTAKRVPGGVATTLGGAFLVGTEKSASSTAPLGKVSLEVERNDQILPSGSRWRLICTEANIDNPPAAFNTSNFDLSTIVQ